MTPEHVDIEATRRAAFREGMEAGLAAAIVLALLVALPLVVLAR